MEHGILYMIYIQLRLFTPIHTGLTPQPIYTPLNLHLFIDIRLKAVEDLETADHLDKWGRGRRNNSGLGQGATGNAGARITGSFEPGSGLLDVALQVVLSTKLSEVRRHSTTV